jgi:RNase P subunit RPR2
MAKKKISKKETEKEIRIFFSKIKNKKPREIKKIKKLAMSHNLKLGNKRKKYCKYCLSPYTGKEKVRINNKIKNITCDNCKKTSRWKI